MKKRLRLLTPDLCVIGAGAGGLSVAAGAAQMGAQVALVERGKMGGDCLNYGCVPSKALLAAAKRAQAHIAGAPFGIAPHPLKINFETVANHVAETIAAIAPSDSQERFESLGVTVIRAAARFTSPREVTAGEACIRARRFVIATGSSPAVPPIAGLTDVPYLTNETIFDNRQCPHHLVIIGGGPIGLEMAQAHRRLGARVSVLEMFTVLAKDDPELSRIVADRLRAEGVALYEQTRIDRVRPSAAGIAVDIVQGERQDTLTASHLLVAAGRTPNTDGLGLDRAGIAYDQKGIAVDHRLRTTNKRVFAIGDVAGGLQFTHVANHHAGIVIRNALFRLPARADSTALPWVTYTDPELASVGLTEAQARERHGDRIRVLRWPFADNDRARAERRTEGLIKVITSRRGHVLGAGIVGPQAGELIFPWVLAMTRALKIGAMASAVAPYPTLSEISKRVAGSYFTPSLFSPRIRWLVRLLAKLG